MKVSLWVGNFYIFKKQDNESSEIQGQLNIIDPEFYKIKLKFPLNIFILVKKLLNEYELNYFFYSRRKNNYNRI
jgi:hypothetical protein